MALDVVPASPQTADTAPPDIAAASALGSSAEYAREDHTHGHANLVDPSDHAIATAIANGFISAADKSKLDGIATGATNTPLSVTTPDDIQPDDPGAVGVGTTAARADHQHAIVGAVAGTSAIGNAAAEGVATSFARSDHQHAITSPSAPADVTKAAASAGASVNMARQDHKHDVTTATAGTIAPDDTAAEGSASTLARSDHRHAITADVAGTSSVGNAAAEGVAATFARSDHQHALTAPAAPADVTKAAASAGAATTIARSDHKHDVTTAVTGSIQPDDAAAEGTATSLARSDHKHSIVTVAPSSIGSANSEGVATSFPRSDHVHDHGTQSVATNHAAATFTANGFETSVSHIALNSMDGRNNAGASPRVFRPGDYMVGNTYDPTGGSNSSSSFTAMIAAVVAFNDRCVIQLPPGVFTVNPAVITGLTGASCGIIGPGRGNCVFVPASAGDFITLPNAMTGSDSFTLHGFTIFNTGAFFTSGSGININGCDGVDISEVAFVNLFVDINVNGSAIKVSMQKIVSFATNPGAANTSVGILVNNGSAGDTYIGPDVVMSDGGGTTRRRACVELIATGHYEINQCNLTGSQVGILIDPGNTATVAFGFHNQVLCDSNTVNGMQLTVTNSATSIIKNIKSVNSWYSGTVNLAAPYNVGQAGVLTAGGAAGIMNGVTFTNDRFLNNRTHGFEHGFGTDFRWDCCDMKGNSSVGSGTAHGLRVAANVSNWSVLGGKYGGTDQATSGGNQGYGCSIAAGTSNNWSIVAADLSGNVTGPIDNGATGTVQTVKDCAGMSDDSALAANVAIANTETVVVETAVPKNSVRAGTTWEVQAGGFMTNGAASSPFFRIKIGATTLGGTIPAAYTAALGATVRTNIPFTVNGMITIKTIGAGGTVLGFCWMNVGNAVIPVVVAGITAAVAVDTTADRLVGLTCISGAATTTFTFTSAIIRPVAH